VVRPHAAGEKSEGQAPIIFGMAVLFVFLLPGGTVRKLGLPFSVLLATPTVIWARSSACSRVI